MIVDTYLFTNLTNNPLFYLFYSERYITFQYIFNKGYDISI